MRNSKLVSVSASSKKSVRKGNPVRSIVLSSLLFAMAAAAATSDLDAIRAEPNLERRSGVALDKAEEHLSAARAAYEAGKFDEFQTHLKSTEELADICYQSLTDSGKKARRNPKWFKRAEQKLLGMLRRVDSLARDVTVDDKPKVEALHKHLQSVHEQVLQDIMTKK